MKIFLSWSGERSKRIAEYLNTWIPCVIQAAEPWISSNSIDRGVIWFQEINNILADVKIGIICLTQENKKSPWILFEAGCLAKGLNSQHVCTLLVDAQPQDIENPLAQFNHTLPQKDSMFELLKTINKQISQPLRDNVLEKAFEKYWLDFEKEFKKILASTPVGKEKKRSHEEILSEILLTVRNIDKRISNNRDNTYNIIENPPNPTLPSSSTLSNLFVEASPRETAKDTLPSLEIIPYIKSVHGEIQTYINKIGNSYIPVYKNIWENLLVEYFKKNYYSLNQPSSEEENL